MVAFNDTKGEAAKSSLDQYTYKMGDNKIRLVGEILPRYVYWVKGENDKNIPMECLAFDRDAEAFLKKEKDWVQDTYPDLKCGWAYVMQGINLEEGKIQVVNLKKKLLQQIKSLAGEEGFGDPTDPVTGWDIYFSKNKTGPNVFNIEYTLQPIKCQKGVRPLTDAELQLVSDMTPIGDLLPRPTPEDQKKLIDRLTATAPDNQDTEVVSEFDVT